MVGRAVRRAAPSTLKSPRRQVPPPQVSLLLFSFFPLLCASPEARPEPHVDHLAVRCRKAALILGGCGSAAPSVGTRQERRTFQPCGHMFLEKDQAHGLGQPGGAREDGGEVFHTMEAGFGGFSTQWKRVSGFFSHNGSRFWALFHTMETCFTGFFHGVEKFSMVWKTARAPGEGISAVRRGRESGIAFFETGV